MTGTRAANTARVERLSTASLNRVVEPDIDVSGRLTKSQVIPDELLSIANLAVDLTPTQRATLSREELASIARFGILFETVLMAGFAYRLTLDSDVTDPRFVYALHEIGEETRHSRLFVRLVDELAPTQHNPLDRGVIVFARSVVLPLLMRRPATLDAFVLAGEEIPDLFQKLAAEHPDTDDWVRSISRYHRVEEARHLAYARTMIGEHYRHTTWSDRFAVRWIVPLAGVAMFDTIVHPYVYPTVGLPAARTWLRVRRQPTRIALRQQCARAVLRALTDTEIVRPGSIPLPWRYAAGVDHTGRDRARRCNVTAAVGTASTRAAEVVGTTARSIWRPTFASLRWGLSVVSQ
jgi:hypothetical protein